MKNPNKELSFTEITKAKKKMLAKEWDIFCSIFPTDEACYEELMHNRHCKRCNSQNIERDYGARKGKCLDCKLEIWLLSKSFFDRIKRPRAWLFAIWLLQRGVFFNSLDLKEITGVAYDTARNINTKLYMFLFYQMALEPMSLQIPSSFYLPVFTRRSFLTPANAHPSAEQEELEKTQKQKFDDAYRAQEEEEEEEEDSAKSFDEKPDDNNQDPAFIAFGDEILEAAQKAVYALLSDEPLHFNQIESKIDIAAAALASLLIKMELAGLIEQQEGDFYACCRTTSAQSKGRTSNVATIPAKGQQAVVDVSYFNNGKGRIAFLDSHQGAGKSGFDDQSDAMRTARAVFYGLSFIFHGFHGISRKCLQIYLAVMWWYMDNERWGENGLLNAVRDYRQIPTEEMKAFVTPYLVTVMV